MVISCVFPSPPLPSPPLTSPPAPAPAPAQAPAQNLLFGVTTSNTGLSGLQFEQRVSTTQPQNVFQFGTQTSSQTSSTSSSMFTFSGANPRSDQANLPVTHSSAQSSSAGFTFSAVSQGTFKFGAATNSAPSFTFGQSSFPTVAAPVLQPSATGQTSQTSMFTASMAPEGSRGGRVIRRARRRKPNT